MADWSSSIVSMFSASQNLDEQRAAFERVVWHIEARALNTLAGGAAAKDAICGTGVVVRIEHLQRVEETSGTTWVSADPPQIRKYLLTCAHVVRGFLPSQPGWNPLLGEILCWPSGSHYLHWQVPERPRRSGGEAKAIGAHVAKVAYAAVSNPGAVPVDEATAENDWVLLCVEDGPGGAFDDAPSVDAWGSLQHVDPRGTLSVTGFPGGAITWQHNDLVTPYTSTGFRLKRKNNTAIALVGNDETRPGMSGGGVFDADGRIVGIHRGATDPTMERHIVPADVIRQWLDERGLRPAPALAKPKHRARSLKWALAAGALPVAGVLGWCTLMPALPSEQTVCVEVSGMQEPFLSQPVGDLHLTFVPTNWSVPTDVTVTTDAKGSGCFKVPLAEKHRDDDTLPFYIRTDNAPGPLEALKPLILRPYGMSTDGLIRMGDAKNLRYVHADEKLSLNLWSQANFLTTRISSEVSRLVPEGGSEPPPGTETDRFVAAVDKLGLTPQERTESIDAWANVLNQTRPVVPARQLDVPDAALIRNVANAVGAYHEDGQFRATGFAVSSKAVLLATHAVSEHVRERDITFGGSSNDTTHRVRLGRILWRSPEETPINLSVVLFEALGRLPPSLQLSDAPSGQIRAGRPVYVVGYPADDPRASPVLRAMFPTDVRAVMFGEALPPDRRASQLEHDATTVAGTSGGPLVDRSSHAVIGVHMSGFFQGLTKTNAAVPMSALLADPGFRRALANSEVRIASSLPAFAQERGDPLRLDSPTPILAAYDPMFLGVRIAFPETRGTRLDYLHYSLVMNDQRRTVKLAAANLDRETFFKLRREPDVWHVDPRLGEDQQLSDDLFQQNRLDRGHLISRQTLMWGAPEVAKLGALAAFYWTNATPQIDRFNQQTWANLETRVQTELQPESPRVTLFAGPVEDASDITYRNQRIPRRFWMIAAYENPSSPNRPMVHAYLAEQYRPGVSGNPDDWPRESLTPTETSVAEIERLTAIRFRFPAQ